MDAIKLINISKSYKNFTLSDINFCLPMGYIMGLVGENGAGKSTIISILLGMKKADKGSISVLGESNISLIKEDIGVVLDECAFHDSLNIKDIEIIMKNSFKNWNGEKFNKLCKQFSLPLDKSFKDYSKGMKMKASIAVCLSHNPKILIMDEPTAGLDPFVRNELIDIFYDFVSDDKHSILISSHIISDLEKLCDYITFIHKGKLIFSDEKDSLHEKYSVIKCDSSIIKNIDKEKIIGMRKNEFGIEALVKSHHVPDNITYERASIEDIIIYTSKEMK